MPLKFMKCTNTQGKMQGFLKFQSFRNKLLNFPLIWLSCVRKSSILNTKKENEA